MLTITSSTSSEGFRITWYKKYLKKTLEGDLMMFIANLYTKVDFLRTCKLMQLNRKTPFEGKPRNSKTTSPSKQNECVVW